MTHPPRIKTAETWDGYAYVNGRIHGSKWKRVWEVVVRVDSEEEARAWIDHLKSLPDVTALIATAERLVTARALSPEFDAALKDLDIALKEIEPMTRPTQLIDELRASQIKTGVEVKLLAWIDHLESLLEDEAQREFCESLPEYEVYE
ncbi:MAG: hypothetical protein ABIH23_11190 [bacterium]